MRIEAHLSFIATFLLVDGFWALKLYHEFGSPVFPFQNQIFHSPYVATSFTGRDMRFIARKAVDYVLPAIRFAQGGFRTTFSQEMPIRDFRLFFLAVSALGFGISKCFGATLTLSREKRFVLWFWIVAYLVWVRQFYYYRYFAPLEFLVPLVGVILFDAQSVISKSNKRLKTGLAFVVLFFFLVTTHSTMWGRIDWGPSWFGISEQSLVLPPQSVVVLQDVKMSFIIPFFSRETRFIHINSLEPFATDRFNDQVRAKLAEPAGHFYLVTNGDPPRATNITNWGFSIDGDCTPIPNRVSEKLELCSLKRQ